MVATAGVDFVAQIVDPAGGVDNLGARVDTPDRAVVAYWRPATLDPDTGIWSVTQNVTSQGQFLFVWRTASGVDVQFEPLDVQSSSVTGAATDYPPVDVPSITPSVDQVAALEGTRLTDENGENPQSTFNTTTYPTDTMVSALISQAVQQTLAALPTDRFDPKYYSQLQDANALLAAALIEASYFQEQEFREKRPELAVEAIYERLYNASLASINAQIVQDMTTQTTGLY